MNYCEAFESALVADRYDVITRLAYADWLTEHGEDDQAAEQIRRASAAWIEADQRMHKLADNAGTHCSENYGAEVDYDYESGTSTPTGLVEKWERVTYDMVMKAAGDWLKLGSYKQRWGDPNVFEWAGEWWVQLGDETLRNTMTAEDVCKQFWADYQTITGTTVEENKQGRVFSCSC